MQERLTFREKMKLYSNESLKTFAVNLGLKDYSNHRKAELIEKIAEFFLSDQALFSRLALLDNRTMRLLEAGSKGYVKMPDDYYDRDTVCVLHEMELVYITDERTYSALSDVWEKYEKIIAGEKFEEYRKKASWVWKCFRWVQDMCGIVPEEIFVEIINSKKRMDLDTEELRSMYINIPRDRACVLRRGDHYVYDLYIENKMAAEYLLDAQQDKDFYIPTPDEVDEYYRTNALISKKAYQDMNKFLINDMKINKNEAQSILKEIWEKITLDDGPHDTMKWFMEELEFKNDKMLNKAVNLYMNVANSTNLLANRGYAPADMPYKQLFPDEMPTIVPGSSQAAELLSEAMPKLKKKGFNIDLEGEATTIPVFSMPNGVNGPVQAGQRKIYPNDPCPCGSGKKYKKCCGKK